MVIFGMETITVQNDDMCSKIASLVDEVRNIDGFTIYSFSDALNDMLTKRYGLSFSVNITDDPGIDFWTYENVFMENNVISSSKTKNLVGSRDIITADIDLKKAYISGSIQKYIFYIFATRTALLGKSESGDYILDSHEFAASILHEVGHGFNYVSYMVDTVKMAAIVRTRTNDLVNSNREQRIKLINSEYDLKNMSNKEKEDLLDAYKEDSISVIIMKHIVEQRNAQAGMNYYSHRANEQSADLFAMRNGAGKYIGTLLSKITCKRSAFDTWAGDILLCLFTVGLPIIVSAVFFNWSFEGNRYDNNTDRCIFAKRELVNQLKTAKTKNEKDKLLSEIEVYDKLYEVYKNPPKGLFYYIQYFTSSKYRANAKQCAAMKDIEYMIDNDLYVAANKLKR